MGCGTELKKCLDKKNMRVVELARRTGISKTTLYSAITRDSAIRYDYALLIADVLDIDPGIICDSIPTVKVAGDADLKKLIETYDILNDADRIKLVKYAEKLTRKK